ncbi:phosphoglycerate dehydrogenase [Cellulomonas sp. NPDC055163]
MTTVLIPTGLDLDPTLPDDVEAAWYDPREPVPEEHVDAEVLVVWASPAHVLEDAARRLHRLRWVQTFAAGPDAVLGAGFADDVVVTSGRGLHDDPVAEHTLALVLAGVRALPDLVRAQDEHRWARELSGNHPGRPADALRTLSGAHVLVWGFGSIAARFAPLLTALGAHVTGVATTAGERAGYPVIAASEVGRALPGTDVLVAILPATEATRHAIGADVLAQLPRHAWVVNVGRGSTLDEAALLDALRGDRLGGAALDVFETEPLPADSPLWSERRVIVSPHAAGGRPVDPGGLLTENLALFVAGRPLRNTVTR